MCGRYALAGDWSEFSKEFELDEVPGLEARYNIAPSQGPGFEAPVIVSGKKLRAARFWYIPSFWTRPLKELPTSFNARSETALVKPFFSGAERCLIPTSGWREFPGPAKNKRAFSFERRTTPEGPEGDRARFFAFGGLYSEWLDPETGEVVPSFAILTCAPSDAVKPYHDRMPLLVGRDQYAPWLDASQPTREALTRATHESHSAFLTVYECSTYGNSTRNEGPACISPVMSQRTLFD